MEPVCLVTRRIGGQNGTRVPAKMSFRWGTNVGLTCYVAKQITAQCIKDDVLVQGFICNADNFEGIYIVRCGDPDNIVLESARVLNSKKP